ncbi:MAG: alanyl-tRNA editing protein [Cetobacterium sp.]
MINVISCFKDNQNWIVEVESHDLYIDGKGGQNGDQGLIGDTKFTQVLNENRLVVENEILPGKYTYSIDKNRVFDIAVQHSAQHLFSAIAYNDYGLNTVGFRMTETYTTVDLDSKDLDDSFIDELEKKINKVIGEGKRISTTLIDRDTANNIKTFRKKISDKVVGDVRIVTIDTLDTSACAGYHVSNISEIRIFKIINSEKIKGNYTRFYFLSGERAIYDFLNKNKTIKELNKIFSCKDDEILCMIDKFSTEKKENEIKCRDLYIKISELLAPKLINEIIEKEKKKYIVYKDTKEIIENLNKIIPKDYIFIGIWENGGLISSYNENCNDLLKKISENSAIKGGGKVDRVNFKGETSVEEITNIL